MTSIEFDLRRTRFYKDLIEGAEQEGIKDGLPEDWFDRWQEGWLEDWKESRHKFLQERLNDGAITKEQFDKAVIASHETAEISLAFWIFNKSIRFK